MAWLAVPEIADWCAVELIDERGSRQQIAVAHRDPAKLELAQRLREFQPQELRPDRGVGRVLRTGTSEIYQDISDEVLVAAATSDEHLSLLRAVGFRSVRAGAAEGGAARLRRDDAGQRRVDAALRRRRPRVRRAGGGTRGDRGRERAAGHRPPPDRHHAPAQPAPRRRPRDRGLERRHAVPGRPRRGGGRGGWRLLRLLPERGRLDRAAGRRHRQGGRGGLAHLAGPPRRAASSAATSAAPAGSWPGSTMRCASSRGCWLCTALCARLQSRRGGDRLGRPPAGAGRARRRPGARDRRDGPDPGRLERTGRRSIGRCRSPPTRRCSSTPTA